MQQQKAGNNDGKINETLANCFESIYFLAFPFDCNARLVRMQLCALILPMFALFKFVS